MRSNRINRGREDSIQFKHSQVIIFPVTLADEGRWHNLSVLLVGNQDEVIDGATNDACSQYLGANVVPMVLDLKLTHCCRTHRRSHLFEEICNLGRELSR